MFTGIITEIGTIAALDQRGDWVVTIAAPRTATDLALGASVACSGVCLTVIEKREGGLVVQVSPETLGKTCAKSWHVGTRLNLERALRLGDELGGHMVSGHVDGVATLVKCEPEQDSLRFVFEVPSTYACFLAPKGSICLDGVSLTINEVEGSRFGVNIIPHTQKETTLGAAKPGDSLNFEIDLIARYVGRMLDVRGNI